MSLSDILTTDHRYCLWMTLAILAMITQREVFVSLIDKEGTIAKQTRLRQLRNFSSSKLLFFLTITTTLRRRTKDTILFEGSVCDGLISEVSYVRQSAHFLFTPSNDEVFSDVKTLLSCPRAQNRVDIFRCLPSDSFPQSFTYIPNCSMS